jgi:hypothetical protein
MIRNMLLAIYVAVSTLGFGYLALTAGLFTPASSSVSAAGSVNEKFENIRIRQLSVPILKDGAVTGYVMVQLAANISPARAKALPMKIEDILVDEAFRVIHALTSDETARASKFDLDGMTAGIVERANKSARQPVVQSVLVQDIAFIDKKDIRR